MRSLFTTTAFFVLLLASCLTSCSQKEGIVRPAELQPVRKLFSLSDVRVTDPQMLSLQELDHEYLKSLEVDRLLSLFRKESLRKSPKGTSRPPTRSSTRCGNPSM